jgi:hypothetical protein
MRNRLRIAVLIAIATALSGCGGTAMLKDDSTPTSNTLVFGYIDMTDAPVSLDKVSIRQMLPKTSEAFLEQDVDDGMFFNSFLKNGSFYIYQFGGASWGFFKAGGIYGKERLSFDFKTERHNFGRFKIENPGLQFLGSYKYKKIETGFFESDKYEVEAVNSPTERELLERLAKVTTNQAWETKISKRIQELRK